MHIDRFARALFEHAGGGLLYVLGGDDLPAYQREGERRDRPLHARGRARARARRRATGSGSRALLERLPDLRDRALPRPVERRADRRAPGPRATPRSTRSTGCRRSSCRSCIRRSRPRSSSASRELEQRCLERGRRRDHAVGRSPRRGCGRATRARDPQRRRPPAARRAARRARSATSCTSARCSRGRASTRRCARSRACPTSSLDLVICASVHQRRAKPYRKLAEKLGVADRVHWHFALPEAELARWQQHALLCARAAEGLLAQRRPGLRAAEDPRVDGGGHAGRRLRPARGARAA